MADIEKELRIRASYESDVPAGVAKDVEALGSLNTAPTTGGKRGKSARAQAAEDDAAVVAAAAKSEAEAVEAGAVAEVAADEKKTLGEQAAARAIAAASQAQTEIEAEQAALRAGIMERIAFQSELEARVVAAAKQSEIEIEREQATMAASVSQETINARIQEAEAEYRVAREKIAARQGEIESEREMALAAEESAAMIIASRNAVAREGLVAAEEEISADNAVIESAERVAEGVAAGAKQEVAAKETVAAAATASATERTAADGAVGESARKLTAERMAEIDAANKRALAEAGITKEQLANATVSRNGQIIIKDLSTATSEAADSTGKLTEKTENMGVSLRSVTAHVAGEGGLAGGLGKLAATGLIAGIALGQAEHIGRSFGTVIGDAVGDTEALGAAMKMSAVTGKSLSESLEAIEKQWSAARQNGEEAIAAIHGINSGLYDQGENIDETIENWRSYLIGIGRVAGSYKELDDAAKKFRETAPLASKDVSVAANRMGAELSNTFRVSEAAGLEWALRQKAAIQAVVDEARRFGVLVPDGIRLATEALRRYEDELKRTEEATKRLNEQHTHTVETDRKVVDSAEKLISTYSKETRAIDEKVSAINYAADRSIEEARRTAASEEDLAEKEASIRRKQSDDISALYSKKTGLAVEFAAQSEKERAEAGLTAAAWAHVIDEITKKGQAEVDAGRDASEAIAYNKRLAEALGEQEQQYGNTKSAIDKWRDAVSSVSGTVKEVADTEAGWTKTVDEQIAASKKHGDALDAVRQHYGLLTAEVIGQKRAWDELTVVQKQLQKEYGLSEGAAALLAKSMDTTASKAEATAKHVYALAMSVRDLNAAAAQAAR